MQVLVVDYLVPKLLHQFSFLFFIHYFGVPFSRPVFLVILSISMCGNLIQCFGDLEVYVLGLL